MRSSNSAGVRATDSPVADGILGPRGFRVTSPNLARQAGLEVGDVILMVNGQQINSFGDLYAVYRNLKRAGHRLRVDVSLERQGVPVTKTYLLR
jgi:S1-C subfamily serine protease